LLVAFKRERGGLIPRGFFGWDFGQERATMKGRGGGNKFFWLRLFLVLVPRRATFCRGWESEGLRADTRRERERSK